MIQEKLWTAFHSGRENSKEFVVLHHTATGAGTLRGVLRHLTQSGEAGAHFVIDENGKIFQINDENFILWHCGKSSWEGRTDLNRFSIGIEVLGPLPGFRAEQRAALQLLVTTLCRRRGIAPERVIRHLDIAPGRKIDPADSLWDEIFSRWEDFQRRLVLGWDLRENLENLKKSATMARAVAPLEKTLSSLSRRQEAENVAWFLEFSRILLDEVWAKLEQIEQLLRDPAVVHSFCERMAKKNTKI